ncbi:MAG TPA: MBL fold metallo-hydrolase [Bacteroidales bacterium]|nr:MBL fold metallo-hydrolase [Bacteroidales bacterium]
MKTNLLFYFFLVLSLSVFGQANGKFQMHFMDVGQGDAALLISPGGETVLFDEGVDKYCDMPTAYLESVGVTSIDYLVTSHYHDDHIGCTKQILDEFPLNKTAYDRGGTYPSTVFDRYVEAVGAKRKTAVVNDRIILDQGTSHEVTITFMAMNGAGIRTDNENDLSLVALVSFGPLDIMMGGDLSGYSSGDYRDIESKAAQKVSQVEVYKVHHHCSQYSSNTTWLNTIKPRIGIISASGEYGRHHGHPTAECLERLHQEGVKTYWTETGEGAQPDPQWDVVSGDIIIQADPGSLSFTVRHNQTRVDRYSVWGTDDQEPASSRAKYGWSTNSEMYHYIDCSWIKRINSENLQTGDNPPDGKYLHKGCPKN